MKDVPTLASGNGILTESDMVHSSTKLLWDHETQVRDWIAQANPYQLKAAVDTALGHSYFARFKQNLWDTIEERKFGSDPHEDILKFDLWLKKMEISEKKVKTPSPKPDPSNDADGRLAPPANRQAYQQYWNQYKRQGASTELSTPSTATPAGSEGTSPATTSPDASGTTGITPDAANLNVKGQLSIAVDIPHDM